MSKTAKWGLAIVCSLAAHAGAAVVLMPGEEAPMIAGGAPVEVAMIGSAFETVVESGSPSAEDEALAPIETASDVVAPVETDMAAASPDVATLQPEAPAEIPPEPTRESAPEAVSEIAPSAADVILPAEELPPVAAEPPEIVASLPPAMVVPVPRPEPELRPAPPEKTAAPREKAQRREAKQEMPPPREKRGEKGQGERSEQRGQDDGVASGRSAGSSNPAPSRAQPLGNAAVSNYKGKVQDRVSRLASRLARQNRDRVNATTVVAFSVTRAGGATGVRLTRSTGSPALDAAIVDGLQSLSYPKFPAGYAEATWAFTMPIRIR